MAISHEISLDFSHNVYKNDPLQLKNYVGKKVNVITEDKRTHSGIVYTIDPVSESVVLLQPKEDNRYSLEIIIGRAVQNIEISSNEETVFPDLFPKRSPKFSQSVILERKDAVKKLLSDNRFPVTERGEVLYIEDTLSIEPPYGPDNCICTNSVILRKIQDILVIFKN